MSVNSGENEQGLRKVIDLTRMISVMVLLLHFYFYCYAAFSQWHLTAKIPDVILKNIAQTGLFRSFNKTKWIALGALLLSLVGAKGKKSEKLNYKIAFAYLITGLIVYFISALCLYIPLVISTIAILYISITAVGYVLIMTGGGLISRIIKDKLGNDIFNKQNETFPQEERLLENEYSINLPAQYNLKGKLISSWINFINPMRGLLVMGSPGAGKSYFIIQHIIKQHIEKGFAMFVYDFKYDDLSRIAYNQFLKFRLKKYKVEPKFHVINFDDLSRCHRCNPLDPNGMLDITDAVESARTIMLGLNRSWIKRQGEFFVESPINFLTSIIWFLRKFHDGDYCSLPHAIELMQVDYDKLFTVLRTEPEIEAYLNPFISAFENNSMEQLQGQIDAARISIARLSSPALYYVLSGNDFTLDINNPDAPKIVCLANNPQKQQVYGAVLSLYSKSKQLEQAIPASTIASLSSGEFVGMVADNPDQVINLKAFHCKIINDHRMLENESKMYEEIPEISKADSSIVQRNYQQIKQEVQDLIESEMEKILNDPAKEHMVVKK